MTRRHVPTAGQFFGFLGLLMGLAYVAGWVQANWPSIVGWLTSAAPWWVFPLGCAVVLLAFLGLLLWLEIRRPVLDCQRECCADWRRERGS